MKLRERPIVLVTGGAGFLGYNTVRSLRHDCEVYYAYHQTAPTIPGVRGYPLELRSREMIECAVDKVRPDAVVHLAGMTNAAACQADWDTALAINGKATETLLEVCGGDIRLIYVSTDYVRHGSQKYIDEDVLCRPESHYGKSKYYGEQAMEESFSRGHIVLRASLVYGWGRGPRHGFLDWLWGALSHGEKVCAFTDEYRTPIFLKDFITAVRAAISHPRGGRFHVAGSQRLSRYEFAQRFCQAMGIDLSRVEPATLDSDPANAIRPREGGLANERMRTILGVVPTSMERALQIIRDEILGESRSLAASL